MTSFHPQKNVLHGLHDEEHQMYQDILTHHHLEVQIHQPLIRPLHRAITYHQLQQRQYSQFIENFQLIQHVVCVRADMQQIRCIKNRYHNLHSQLQPWEPGHVKYCGAEKKPSNDKDGIERDGRIVQLQAFVYGSVGVTERGFIEVGEVEIVEGDNEEWHQPCQYH